MTTGIVNLDTSQYVKISDGLKALTLQANNGTVRIVVATTQPAKGNSAFHPLGGPGVPSMMTLPFTDGPVWALPTTNNTSLVVTEERNSVEVSARGSIGTAVFIQDQTTDLLNLPFLTGRTPFTITTTMTKDSNVFEADPGHGIVIGDVLEFANLGIFMKPKVMGVSVNTITVDSLINHAYTSADSFTKAKESLLVDGSVTPVVFSIAPSAGQSGDILGVTMFMKSNNNMDFSLFGSLPPVTKGCLLRTKRQNGDYRNLVNFKSNGELIEEAFDHYFQEKVGGGEYGFTAQVKYGGPDRRGVAIRLDGLIGEELQLVIQDDLTAGTMVTFKATAFGHELQENF